MRRPSATGEWIVKKDPKFFERESPFIGYVEFLLETSVHGGQRVGKVDIRLGYGRSGVIAAPPGADESDHWKFRGPEVK